MSSKTQQQRTLRLHRCSISPATGQRGFTLPEMLAVVAVIVILISLLLPSLGRARETTRRAICASNLSQVGKSMRAYSLDNKGRIPLGFVDSARGSTYHMIWGHTTPHRYLMMGSLVPSEHIGGGQIFYCPSQKLASVQHDTSTNRWDAPYSVGGVKKPTRSGYSVRPLLDAAEWHWGTNSAPSAPANLPLISSLNNIVIASDITSLELYVDNSHVEGVNAVRTDGSVAWVTREKFDPYLETTLYATVANNLWKSLDGN